LPQGSAGCAKNGHDRDDDHRVTHPKTTRDVTMFRPALVFHPVDSLEHVGVFLSFSRILAAPEVVTAEKVC
jgi:hypothetical protein